MPSTNRIKDYIADDYYHIYNRGVERRIVFIDDQDYRYFIATLKLYVTPNNPFMQRHNDVSDQVEIAAFCLMPNHFHLLLRQITERGMEAYMRRVMARYVKYFNTRYNRVGSLFQDTYKAVHVDSDEQLHQVEQYIYLNPHMMIKNVADYPYSSLKLSSSPSWILPPVRTGRSWYAGSSLAAELVP